MGTVFFGKAPEALEAESRADLDEAQAGELRKLIDLA
jgi:hypothetical protein